MKKKIRAVQYGVGPIGAAIVRLMREKNSIEIIGAIDSDPAKAGQDLGDVVGGADAKPTSQSYTVFNDLSSQLDRQLSAMRGSLIDLSPINASLKAQGLPPIVPSTEEIKAPGSRTIPSGSGEDEVEK